jgi:putative drug exporter of the RND superfamily
MLASLARFCFRKRRLVLALWVVAFVGIGAAQGAVGPNYRTEFGLKKTESTKGFDILKKSFGVDTNGFGGQLVVSSEKGFDDPAVRAPLEKLFTTVSKIKGVTLESPFTPQGAAQIAQQGPNTGKVLYANIDLARGVGQERVTAIGKEINKAMPKIDGAEILLGGQAFAAFEPPASELIGLAFAVVILILAFGSVLAMGLPIGTAIAGIFVGSGIVVLLSRVIQIPDFTSFVAIMIGLGVGIDYVLFIITRYRDNLKDGMSFEDGTVEAMDTAGRAVLFAGVTVVISVLGMWLMGLKFIQGLATGAAITVLAVLAATMTLLPALLGFAGNRVGVTRWRGIIAAGFLAVAFLGAGLKLNAVAALGGIGIVATIALSFVVPALRKELPHRKEKPLRETIWYRWSRVVQHRPWPMAILGFVALGVLAAPVLSLRLGFADEGNLPKDTDARVAYDKIAETFGAGFSSPMIVVANLASPADLDTMGKISAAVAKDPNVAFASPPIPNDPTTPTAALIRVVAKSSAQDRATESLVNRLRNDVVPTAVGDAPVAAFVTGSTPSNIDFSSYLAGRTPIFFGAVLGLSFLLLMAVFRSLLVPLKAVIMNLLSIGAAYGVVVAMFQWGWGASLVGIGKGGPIEPFLPMMLFAIVFGLSMDYEVFLLSRMKEEFDRTKDNAAAVADGLAMTARVITAAAAIMVVVFGAFVFEDTRTVKMFGVGLAAAVFLDATIVRMLLVPATMELLGNKNWWLPKWLDRAIPNLNVEGHHHEAPGMAREAATASR